MANKDFNQWLSQFRETIATWRYYTNFEKCYKNSFKIRTKLHTLNALIGSQDIENEFRQLVEDDPGILSVIPILLAKRENEILIQNADEILRFDFKKPNYTVNDYVEFMGKTGLFDMLQNHRLSNLYDYVYGVEVGMDTNARKNRTGDAMEDLIESYLLKYGLIKDKTYWKEMYKSDVQQRFGIDLSNMSNNEKDNTEKRFDFVVKISNVIYGIECNFYHGGGSKLTETSRSYKKIAEETKEVNNFKFVWFTDGYGWKKHKNNLKDTFDVLDDIYNLNELENGVLNKILK